MGGERTHSLAWRRWMCPSVLGGPAARGPSTTPFEQQVLDDVATDQAAHDAVDVQLGGRDRERGVAGVVGPQAVPRGPVTGARRAPLQVLERIGRASCRERG